MAGQMFQQQMRSATAVAATAQHGHDAHAAHHAHEGSHAGHTGAHDCDTHLQAGPDGATAEGTPSECPTCASCQVCSAVALAMDVPAASTAGTSQPRPDTVPTVHASAEQPLALKPPRS
jgi:hypothetical protein